jgi:peptidoglycan hydrolase-like protein with peptidoglycan-binding domain
MGNLGFLMKLYKWYKHFIALLKGEVAPSAPVIDAFTVQLALIRHGYLVKLTGTLDEPTREHLRKFQKDKGLSVDGLFGPQTQKALGLGGS